MHTIGLDERQRLLPEADLLDVIDVGVREEKQLVSEDQQGLLLLLIAILRLHIHQSSFSSWCLVPFLLYSGAPLLAPAG